MITEHRRCTIPRTMALTLVLALAAAACGDDTTTTTNSYSSANGGFTFSYPGNWEAIPGLETATQVGRVDAIDFVAVGVLDPTSTNLIGASVEADSLSAVVSVSDERLFLESQFDLVMTDLAAQAGGTITRPEWTTVAGHDARIYVIESVVRGQVLTSRMTAVVVGDRFYKILCQAPPEEFAATTPGCDLIASTFALP